MDNSMRVKIRRAPNATKFRKFEISWSATERELLRSHTGVSDSNATILGIHKCLVIRGS